MRIDIVTIFPDYFAPLRVSLIGKAAARGDIEFGVHDLRQWARDVHRTVDDTPFGGGPGMVMKPDVWAEALDTIVPPNSPRVTPVTSLSEPPRATPATSLPDVTDAPGEPETSPAPPPPSRSAPEFSTAPAAAGPRLVVPTPSGVPFTQAHAVAYAACPHLIFACGRYEGIDGRFAEDARTRMPVDEVSIGDYVLAGGEAAVLVMVEAVGRLLPGVLGNERSASDDSFGGGEPGMAGLLEGPVYTRPRTWRGRAVPDVLLSGDHAAIDRWRRDAALRRTAAHRPDLIQAAIADPDVLSPRDRKVLDELDAEQNRARLPVWSRDMAH